MRKELEEVLYQRYPALFARRELAPGQLTMRWGFECGDGWFDLIDTLCSSLEYRTNHGGAPQVRVNQVKSKLGTLRFNFVGSGDEYARGMRDMALSISAIMCEECGALHCAVDHGAG